MSGLPMMKAIADLHVLPSGNCTPESGTFDSSSPFSQSPNSTQQAENLKKTITSDYSPSCSQRFSEQEIETFGNQKHDSEEEQRVNIDERANTNTNPIAEEIVGEAKYDNSVGEKRYHSLPTQMNDTQIESKEPWNVDNSLFEGLTESQTREEKRRKLKPPAITKEVDETGDTLTLESLGVAMEIPPGALEKPVAITLTVVWDEGFRPELSKEESNVCPIVRCLPNGLHFHKPVKIRIPHCAVFGSGKKLTTNVHRNEKGEGKMREREREK